MCQRLDEIESTARGSVEGVFIMFNLQASDAKVPDVLWRTRISTRSSSTVFVSNVWRSSVSAAQWFRERKLTLSINENFKASIGWLEKFLLHHNLVSRRPTTTCQKEPEEYAEKIVDYLLFIEQRHHTSNYTYIYAADETAVYLDCSSSLTIENKGVQEVPVKTSGHDKLHLTVMLAARSDGFICRPYILLKNKWPINSWRAAAFGDIRKKNT